MNEHVFTIDESGWPIVKGRWSGSLAPAELTQILTAMDRWLARRERFGFLLDARGGQGLTSEQRRTVVAHMKASAPLTSQFLVQAIVHDNAILRTLDNTIGWMLPRPFVSKTFADPQVALTWLHEQLGTSPSSPSPT